MSPRSHRIAVREFSRAVELFSADGWADGRTRPAPTALTEDLARRCVEVIAAVGG